MLIHRHFLYATLVLFSVFTSLSCSNSKNKDSKIIKELIENLEKSNKIINNSTDRIYNEIINKVADPSTNYKAEIWQSKADKVHTHSETIFNEIEKLKKEDDDNKNLSDLFDKIKKYKKEMLIVDSLITNQFKTEVLAIAFSENSNYNKYSISASKALLCKLQNNIRINENRIITFCRENIPSYDRYYNSYSVLIGQNTESLFGGQQIEITAGIGVFSRVAKPKIIINTTPVPLNENGLAILKFNVQKKPGNYSIPVQVQFLDFDGREITRDLRVEYTVAKECPDQ